MSEKSEKVETFYHHAFVAEGVNENNEIVYFVAQFHEDETIPEENKFTYTRDSTDLQV